jgi:hypothetical protein
MSGSWLMYVRGVAALALLVLAAGRCAVQAPIPGTPEAPAPGTATVTAVAPTADPAVAAALAAYASMRRVSLPWLGANAPGGGPDSAAPPADVAAEPPTAEPSVAPVAGCRGITVRAGDQLAIDGQPFTFFGVNAHYMLDTAFDEGKVEPLLAEMADRGINTVRLFYFPYHDPDRMERLLDAGKRHGIRFVVTLDDDVFKGVNWFIDKEAQAKYVQHLDQTVQRFKDRPEVLMWELVNEPTCGEGRYDDDCLETIRGWIGDMARRVVAIDPCRPVSTGSIGDGNYESEQRSFRVASRKPGVGIVSVHRRDVDKSEGELAFAKDEQMPIFYGEIYDEAFDDSCNPLGGDRSPSQRARRVKSDLRTALDDGVDGYLLWDYAAAGYCSTFGFPADDPVWEKLRNTGSLPPPVPWR